MVVWRDRAVRKRQHLDHRQFTRHPFALDYPVVDVYQEREKESAERRRAELQLVVY